MRTSLLLLAAAVAVPSGNAEAQSWDAVKSFLNVCVMGSLNACGSVTVRTHWDAEAGLTYVEMVVRNEDGDPNNGITTAGSFITAIGLTAPTLAGLDNFALAIEGSVGVTESTNTEGGNYSPLDLWDVANGGLGGQVEFKAQQTGTLGEGTDGLDGGIRGCNEPYSSANAFFTTCDALTYTGGVLFSFTTANYWTAYDAEIVLKFQDLGTWDDDNLSLVCKTGAEEGEHECAVVPEPGTWGLLLTGMIGLLGMGWLRRREEDTAYDRNTN